MLVSLFKPVGQLVSLLNFGMLKQPLSERLSITEGCLSKAEVRTHRRPIFGYGASIPVVLRIFLDLQTQLLGQIFQHLLSNLVLADWETPSIGKELEQHRLTNLVIDRLP